MPGGGRGGRGGGGRSKGARSNVVVASRACAKATATSCLKPSSTLKSNRSPFTSVIKDKGQYNNHPRDDLRSARLQSRVRARQKLDAHNRRRPSPIWYSPHSAHGQYHR